MPTKAKAVDLNVLLEGQNKTNDLLAGLVQALSGNIDTKKPTRSKGRKAEPKSNTHVDDINSATLKKSAKYQDKVIKMLSKPKIEFLKTTEAETYDIYNLEFANVLYPVRIYVDTLLELEEADVQKIKVETATFHKKTKNCLIFNIVFDIAEYQVKAYMDIAKF